MHDIDAAELSMGLHHKCRLNSFAPTLLADGSGFLLPSGQFSLFYCLPKPCSGRFNDEDCPPHDLDLYRPIMTLLSHFSFSVTDVPNIRESVVATNDSTTIIASLSNTILCANATMTNPIVKKSSRAQDSAHTMACGSANSKSLQT